METTQYPRIRDYDKPAKALATKCDRCGGSGIYHTYGVCFRCGGNGVDPTYRDWGYPVEWTDGDCQAWNLKRTARNAKARARASAKREAERKSTWDDNVAACPALQIMHDEVMDGVVENSMVAGDFLSDLRFKAFDFPLSDKQTAAFTKAWGDFTTRRQEKIDRDNHRAATVPAWEEGRQEVEGKVATLKWQENDFGGSLKMRLVNDQDQGLWVTCPSSIDAEVGDIVHMTVKVTPSDDDPTFGFGSRPTKARVV